MDLEKNKVEFSQLHLTRSPRLGINLEWQCQPQHDLERNHDHNDDGGSQGWRGVDDAFCSCHPNLLCQVAIPSNNSTGGDG